MIELQNFSAWFFVTSPCDWWKKKLTSLFRWTKLKTEMKKKTRFCDNCFQACGSFIHFFLHTFSLFASGLCVSDLLWRLLSLVLGLRHSIGICSLIRTVISDIIIQDHLTRLIFENKTKLCSELRFPSFTSSEILQ